MVAPQDPDAGWGRGDESAWVAAVRALGLLDTPSQERFDRITWVARTLLEVPLAEINFLDEVRQFTRSPQQAGQSAITPREDSFCDVAIRNGEILVVPDATKDSRFSWKVTVAGERHIRFYAGYPLQFSGHTVGTLCVIDTVPRGFSADDRAVLERLGRWVEAEINDQTARARAEQTTAAASPGKMGDLVVPPGKVPQHVVPQRDAFAEDSEVGASPVGSVGNSSGQVRAWLDSPPANGRPDIRATPDVLATSEILSTALRASSEGVIVTDAGRNIIFANQAVQTLTGYSALEMVGLNCRFLQGPQTDRGTVAEIKRALDSGTTFRGLLRNYRKDGTEFWNDLTIAPILGVDGDVTHFVSVQRDSTELVALREDLRVQLERVKQEAESAKLLLHVSRLLSSYSSVNDITDVIADSVREVCGADRSAVTVWDPLSERLSMTAQSGWPAHVVDRFAGFTLSPADLPELAALAASGGPMFVGTDASPPMRLLLEQFEVAAFVAMPISARGKLRGVLLAHWVDAAPLNISSLLEERLEGLSHLAAVALENTSLTDQAVWSGTHDALTQLPDRTVFEGSLHQRLEDAATSAEEVAVLHLDIDRFKRTNDALGPHAGDEVLRHVATTLREVGSEADFIARVGGDEFVIVLSHPHAEEAAEQIATRIRTQLDAPLRIDGQDVFVSLSIGTAISDTLDRGLSLRRQAEKLTATADAAMHRDKAARSGGLDQASGPRELAIDSALRGAVARGELTAHFQPQLTLATGAIMDVEALARWHHPHLGNVPPDEFIPIAEKNGVIHEIGAEMLRQALTLGTAAAAAGTPVSVAVNVSVMQLMQKDFLDAVRTILTGSPLPADRITIEMTESLRITDAHQVTGRLQELRDLGMGVSLDDFGTGNTSLMQVHDLPITELKIDQSFVYNDGPAGEALIRGIVELAHSMGIRVVTEGIETGAQLDVIRRLGSDRAQGYHIARPTDRDALLEWLTSYRDTPGALCCN